MRILIAEDDITSRNLLKILLARSGHEVLATVNGAEALEAMQRPDAPRLAILDWMMPEIDGLDLCRRIRAQETDRRPYLIMVTTKGEKADIIAGLDAGADDYLPKPYNPGELHARINVGLRQIEMQDILAGKIKELHQAMDQIKTLRGIVPICSCCKKIRDDQGYWNQVEVYVREHTEAEFSHSLCPECRKELYAGAGKGRAEGNP